MLAQKEMHEITLWLSFGVGQLCQFDLYKKKSQFQYLSYSILAKQYPVSSSK